MRIVFVLMIFFSFVFSKNNLIEYSILIDKNMVDKKTAKLIINVLNKQLNPKDEISLFFKLYTNEKKIRKDFKSGKIKFLTVMPIEYFNNKELYTKYSYSTQLATINKKAFHSFYLIANKQEKNILKNLSKYTVDYDAMSPLSLIWFKTLVYQNSKKEYSKVIKKSKAISKTNSLVHSVFFEKNKLSVISKADYETVLELNPQIKKRVKIIKQTDEIFFYALTIIRKNSNDEELKKFKELTKRFDFLIESISFTSGGVFSGLKKLNKNDLVNSEKLYHEYIRLKNKYEKN